MNTTLHALCDHFISNRDLLKATFPWDSTLIFPACAMLFVEQNKHPDTDTLKACKHILKAHTGVFSPFRATTRLPVIAMLSLSDTPQESLQKTLALYTVLKKHFHSSEYLVLAALSLSNLISPEDYEVIARKGISLYKAIKKTHPFLTSSEDAVFCLLLATSDTSEEAMLTHTEACYTRLKPHFFSGNAVQALSHALALQSGSPEEQCDKVLSLFDDLKQNGYKYGTNFELASLGLLATLDCNHTELLENFTALNHYLKQQKGYGFLGTPEKQRYMHITMLLLKYYGNDTPTNSTTLIGSTLSIIIAQQLAFIAMIASTAATSSAAAN